MNTKNRVEKLHIAAILLLILPLNTDNKIKGDHLHTLKHKLSHESQYYLTIPNILCPQVFGFSSSIIFVETNLYFTIQQDNNIMIREFNMGYYRIKGDYKNN